tara:strand:- start:550 stop:804 length:255 start_codon:yes stop_codon:yes gene_type:complete
MITYTLKKGDLLRNKVTGDIAILRSNPYTRFYPDQYHGVDGIESGVAATCYPLTFTVIQGDEQQGVGAKINVKHSSLLRNWERL